MNNLILTIDEKEIPVKVKIITGKVKTDYRNICNKYKAVLDKLAITNNLRDSVLSNLTDAEKETLSKLEPYEYDAFFLKIALSKEEYVNALFSSELTTEESEQYDNFRYEVLKLVIDTRFVPEDLKDKFEQEIKSDFYQNIAFSEIEEIIKFFRIMLRY